MFACFRVFVSSLLYQRRTIPRRITQPMTSRISTLILLPLDLQRCRKSTPSAMWAGPSFPGPTWTAHHHLVGTSMWNPTGLGCSRVKILPMRYNLPADGPKHHEIFELMLGKVLLRHLPDPGCLKQTALITLSDWQYFQLSLRVVSDCSLMSVEGY